MKAEKSTKFVLDASFVLAYLLPDENSEPVKDLFNQYVSGQIQFFASQILPLEVLNGLKSALKSKRINLTQAQILIQDYTKLNIRILTIDLLKTLEIAREKDLSVYDASYLYLAKETHSPLLTLDEKLKKLI